MNLSKRIASAVMTAVIAATTIAATAATANAKVCPPHHTSFKYLGIAFDQYAGLHEFVY